MRAAMATLVAALAVSTVAFVGALGATSVTTRPRTARTRPTVVPAPTAHPYRWLVETAGSQPSVAAENAHPGTRAWRLPGPASDAGGRRSGDVSGYVSEETVEPGQTERIYVAAPGARTVRISVFRIGWYGGTGGREVLASDPLALVSQPPCRHRSATGLTECDWHPTLTFTIPSALPSGVYIAKLSASTGKSDCLFVVRALTPQPLLAQVPTATYEAYNGWGGDSLYPVGADRVQVTGTTQGVDVSYDRPYDRETGAGQFFEGDVAMVWFLERYGYPVSYTTSESVDENPGQVLAHRGLIDFGHSEYWSQRQADAFRSARDAGVSILFFGSDTMAWRVRYAPASAVASEAGQQDQSIVSYKEYGALDPNHTEPTGPFPGFGASLTGSAYVGCVTPRVNATGPWIYRYYAWSPAPRLSPSWLFAGTGINSDTRIPGIVGYEPDVRTADSPANTRVIGSGAVQCRPPEPGEPHPAPGQKRAQTTLYTAPSGALVFNTGTLGWELGLEPVPSASPNAPPHPDPRIVTITRNLLAHVLASPLLHRRSLSSVENPHSLNSRGRDTAPPSRMDDPLRSHLSADADVRQEDEHEGCGGGDAVQGDDAGGEVLFGWESARFRHGGGGASGCLSAGHPDCEHGESEQGDDEQEREGDPLEAVAAVCEVDDPEHEAGRGE
jgi:hypothetical protein